MYTSIKSSGRNCLAEATNTGDAIKPYAINEKLMANTRIAFASSIRPRRRPVSGTVIRQESLRGGENAEGFSRREAEMLKRDARLSAGGRRYAFRVDNVGGKMSKTSTAGRIGGFARSERKCSDASALHARGGSDVGGVGARSARGIFLSNDSRARGKKRGKRPSGN